MGSLTGVGLSSPGISNGHRAMSCLEGGTFLCLYAFYFYVCLRETNNSIGESLHDIKEGKRVFVVGKKLLFVLGFMFPLSFFFFL